MSKTKSRPVEVGTKLYDPNDVIKDGLEEELDSYTRAAVSKIRFKLIIKPAVISFIALLVSFFIDVSAVPFFGNVTFDLAKSLFLSLRALESSRISYGNSIGRITAPAEIGRASCRERV